MGDLSGKKVLMVIAGKDFRDEEYREPRRILEAAGAKITVASTTTKLVKGMLGMTAQPDVLVSDVKAAEYDAVLFIGGMGSTEYWDSRVAHALARDTVSSGKVLGAICFAPVTLANAGLLTGKKATVYPSESSKLQKAGANYTTDPVARDGNIITGDGPTSAEAFAKAIVTALA